MIGVFENGHCLCIFGQLTDAVLLVATRTYEAGGDDRGEWRKVQRATRNPHCEARTPLRSRRKRFGALRANDPNQKKEEQVICLGCIIAPEVRNLSPGSLSKSS